jgi:hypothetical protein
MTLDEGPAPATPDEGARPDLVRDLADLLDEARIERDEARTKLAAAEAERDAFAAALLKWTHKYDGSGHPDEHAFCCFGHGPDHPIHQTPAVLRRALSVEAAEGRDH